MPDDTDSSQYNVKDLGERISIIKGEAFKPIEVSPNSLVSIASYRHADKLNQLARMNIDTKYVCFIDPDFFIVKDIDKILDRMDANKLAFYGAPYMKHPSKKRIENFPVAFCMIVNTEMVDIKTFDFTPLGMLKDGTMADTGYQIYKKYSEMPEINSYATKSVAADPDIYVDYDHRVFGIHCHAKLHNRNDEQMIARAKSQLEDVKRIIAYDKII